MLQSREAIGHCEETERAHGAQQHGVEDRPISEVDDLAGIRIDNPEEGVNLERHPDVRR